MPKPEGRGRYDDHSWQDYNEHDNRGNRGGGRGRRVTFKHGKFGKMGPRKDWTNSLKSHLEDEDIDMGSSSLGHTRKFMGNRRGRSGSPAPFKGKFAKRKLLESPTNWYRVTLPYGNKYEKDYVLKTLLENITPMPLVPVAWSTNGTVATFYVDDYKLADTLFSLDRQIQCPDGFKLIIRVNSGSPNVDVNSKLKEKMKLTMAKRYNAVNKALDLTCFHADPDLQDIFCALFKPIVLLAALDIMSDNIPELEALNLQENRIQVVNHIRNIGKKLPNLKILHLGNNKIREMSMLDALTGLPLIELMLDGNPVCDKFKDQNTYISEVRKRFPKVIKLDGVALPPPIGFDIAEPISLPSSLQTFLCNSEGQGIVRQFLEQYFIIFDGDSRQPLLQAYHENAVFSLTTCYPHGHSQKTSSWLNWYHTDNRNLLRVQDIDRRLKLLKQGQLSIVSFLNEMPKTKHDIHGFTVDLNLFTPHMLLMTVTGIFKELNSGHKVPPNRYFCRTLIIVSNGSGFCIINEQLHITNATEEQMKVAFKAVPLVPVPQPSTNQAPIAPIVLDNNTKQQMVQAISAQSGMNFEWSQKCLEESMWDFDRAAFVFSELQKQGTIPAEAFIK